MSVKRCRKIIVLLTALALAAGLVLISGCGGRGGDGGVTTPGPDNTGTVRPATAEPDATPMVKEGNVALGCPVTLLNVESPNDGDLTDGDRETAFRGEINYRKSMSTEIRIDLGGIVRVKRLDLYPARQDGFFGRYFPSEIVVRLSTDGNDYTEVCRYSNIDAPDCVPVLEFDARTARYVALDIQSRSVSEDGFGVFELAEVEVISVYREYAYPE
ncbi:MAG: discoidin domain-containing protein [Clostridia bacterium]|nr:discoidin domain-containing protein [Clostridia bacterium]